MKNNAGMFFDKLFTLCFDKGVQENSIKARLRVKLPFLRGARARRPARSRCPWRRTLVARSRGSPATPTPPTSAASQTRRDKCRAVDRRSCRGEDITMFIHVHVQALPSGVTTPRTCCSPFFVSVGFLCHFGVQDDKSVVGFFPQILQHGLPATLSPH